MNSALFAFLHHAAAFVLFAALFTELMLLKVETTPTVVRALSRADAIYGFAAMFVIVVGLVRVYFTEKGATYYLHSGTFIAKIGLFIVIGLISIYPTQQIIALRREVNAQRAPVLGDVRRSSLRRIIHFELTLLMLLILCAALMARGSGYFG